MMRARAVAVSLVLAGSVPLAGACNGSTGGDIFEFQAFAAGAPNATAGEPYLFVNDLGFTVSLEEARIHLGAVYLNMSVPTSVASDTSCILPGIYVAEVTTGLDLDALDPTPVPFPNAGLATADRARTGEVWLTGGAVDAANDSTVIVSVRGVATGAAGAFPFEGAITIGQNRVPPPSDPAQPGEKPVCKQRVVTPIDVDLEPEPGGSLVLRVDPAGWFGNVDFSALEQVQTDPPLYRFRDDSEDQPSRNLYQGIRANAGVYSFFWETE
ncbi:MAG: hypothetical protein HOV80_26245 [Polyangiaceae bacterium]|nr:hypothetical protein [Polyangiaceae bacterium]